MDAGDPTSEQLRQFLSTHDAECPDCGYNLRGVQSDTCPECGRRLTLGLVRAWSSTAYWRVCAGASLAGFFLNSVFSAGYAVALAMGYYALQNFGVGDWLSIVGCPLMAVAALGNLVALAVARRREWTRKRVVWTGILSVGPVLCNGIFALVEGTLGLISMI